jgi:ParB family chromosome partitioning protein
LEIVFGAKRYRASQLAGMETIPALVGEMSDAEMLEAQLIELSIVGASCKIP